MKIKNVVEWMAVFFAIGLIATGVRACIRYEASLPKPAMIIVVEGIKYQNVAQTKTINVNNQTYFMLHEQGE